MIKKIQEKFERQRKYIIQYRYTLILIAIIIILCIGFYYIYAQLTSIQKVHDTKNVQNNNEVSTEQITNLALSKSDSVLSQNKAKSSLSNESKSSLLSESSTASSIENTENSQNKIGHDKISTALSLILKFTYTYCNSYMDYIQFAKLYSQIAQNFSIEDLMHTSCQNFDRKIFHEMKSLWPYFLIQFQNNIDINIAIAQKIHNIENVLDNEGVTTNFYLFAIYDYTQARKNIFSELHQLYQIIYNY